MSPIDPRFLKTDGAIDVEACVAAGHQARSQALIEGWRFVGTALRRSTRAGLRCLFEREECTRALWGWRS